MNLIDIFLYTGIIILIVGIIINIIVKRREKNNDILNKNIIKLSYIFESIGIVIIIIRIFFLVK